ncbi:MAG: hypothetical protein RMK89_12655 [Armatimonadota bacterium]|nr:hypothetical protein [Armatimonadota bacterium]MDW8144299.1 hypothetical protein [Armatimonadota bacterium]
MATRATQTFANFPPLLSFMLVKCQDKFATIFTKFCWCSVTHATGFSQRLIANEASAEFIRREFFLPSKDGALGFRQELLAKAHSVVVKEHYTNNK